MARLHVGPVTLKQFFGSGVPPRPPALTMLVLAPLRASVVAGLHSSKATHSNSNTPTVIHYHRVCLLR